MTEPAKGKYLSRQKIDVTEVHGDLSQQVITITVDRLSLILHQHAGQLEQKHGWVAPLGILIALVITFVTTDFKAFVFNADTWRAIFVVSTVLVVWWLIRSVYTAVKCGTIADLIERIKGQV
jgi:hypothetical protein